MIKKIKRMRMKLDIKIKWNKFLSDEIEKKINNWLKNKKK